LTNIGETAVPTPTDALSSLDKQLDTLMSMLNNGEWERLPDLEPALLGALTAANRPLPSGSVTRQQLESLQVKLTQAIEACITRKEQIAPLVNALSKPKIQP
jgi:hypothetical protein